MRKAGRQGRVGSIPRPSSVGISGSLGAAVTGFMMFGGFCRVLEGAVVRGGEEGKGRGGGRDLGKSIYDEGWEADE